MKKNIVLMRVSSDKQDTEHQRNEITKYINANQIVIHEWLEEDGISGFKTKLEDRVALMKIKDMALQYQIDKLVIFNLDRIGRRMELIGFISLLTECNVQILSVTEGCLNEGNDTDSLLNSVKMWLAEYESKKKSEFVKAGKRVSAKNGNHISGSPTFGYKINNKRLIVDEYESKIVREAFELYIKFGNRRTCEMLNERKLYRRNFEWNRTSLKRTIKNTVYVGMQRYQDALLDYNEKLRIIDDELFNEAQKLREQRNSRGSGTGTRQVNRTSALLEGIFYHICGDGKIRKLFVDYTHRNKDTGVRYRLYRCQHCKEKKYGTVKYTYAAMKHEELIEPAILSLLDTLSVEDLIEQYDKDKNINLEELDLKLIAIEKNLSKNKKGLKNATNELTKIFTGESILEKQTISELVEEFKSKINRDEYELKQLEVAKKIIIESDTTSSKLIEKLKDFRFLYTKASLLEKKIILQELIDKIIIDEEDVEIKLKL